MLCYEMMVAFPPLYILLFIAVVVRLGVIFVIQGYRHEQNSKLANISNIFILSVY